MAPNLSQRVKGVMSSMIQYIGRLRLGYFAEVPPKLELFKAQFTLDRSTSGSDWIRSQAFTRELSKFVPDSQTIYMGPDN